MHPHSVLTISRRGCARAGDHGYDVTHPPTIAVNYLRGWFLIDLLSSMPFDRLLASWNAARAISLHGESLARVAPITLVDIVSLLRIMRIGRLVRSASTLTGANFLRIMYLMYLFVLFGHWLGLVWYTMHLRRRRYKPSSTRRSGP